VSAVGWLVLWGWLATVWALLASFRAQSWLNHWSEVSAKLARALDRIAGLEEALWATRGAQRPQGPEISPRANWARHTRDTRPAARRVCWKIDTLYYLLQELSPAQFAQFLAHRPRDEVGPFPLYYVVTDQGLEVWPRCERGELVVEEFK
jgi:hypothetical protein